MPMPVAQVSREFGILKECLQRWLKFDDVHEGRRPGVIRAEPAGAREIRKRIRLLEQEIEILLRVMLYAARDVNPK